MPRRPDVGVVARRRRDRRHRSTSVGTGAAERPALASAMTTSDIGESLVPSALEDAIVAEFQAHTLAWLQHDALVYRPGTSDNRHGWSVDRACSLPSLSRQAASAEHEPKSGQPLPPRPQAPSIRRGLSNITGALVSRLSGLAKPCALTFVFQPIRARCGPPSPAPP